MIIYKGPSSIDGKPIVAIVTMNTSNRKTGQMPQIWILREDIHPTEALKTGEDYSVCGDCVHRPKQLGDNAIKKYSRTCYVNTMPINAVFKAYKKGKYVDYTNDLNTVSQKLKGLNVRLGAYGDCAFVPIEVWNVVLKYCNNTGYTHQWKICDPNFSKYAMASCDSELDVWLAKSFGYRTFYVHNSEFDPRKIIKDDDVLKMAVCPASKSMGKITTCNQCMACNGNRGNLHSLITIKIH